MALKTGERVTLHYSEKFFQFPWNGDTKYFINNVEFITPPKDDLLKPEPTPVKIEPAKSDSTL